MCKVHTYYWKITSRLTIPVYLLKRANLYDLEAQTAYTTPPFDYLT